MDEILLSVLIDKGEGVLGAAHDFLDAGKRIGIFSVNHRHEDIVHAVTDQGHHFIEEIGYADVVSGKLENQIVLQQIQARRTGEAHAHIKMFAGSVGIEHGHFEGAFETGFHFRRKRFSTIAKVARPDLQFPPFLSLRQRFQDRGIAG